MSLLFGLITNSIVGSLVFGTLLLIRPITGNVFSKTWHYYCLLAPLVFLLGGTHLAVNLPALEPSTAENTSFAFESQEMSMSIPLDYIKLPMFDNSPDIPVLDSEINANLSITSSTASRLIRLIMYLEIITPFLLVFWVLGAVMFIAAGTIKYFKYRCLVLHSAEYISDTDCNIPVIISKSVYTPMLIGVFKPIIVLPNMYPDAELNMILTHEMVHYRRKDLLVKLLMLIANAVHWFNPAVYALNKQLNTACELACDEKVVSEMNTQNRIFYAETILQVLKYSTSQKNLIGNVAFATNLCNSKKNFKRRLISMMNTKKMRKSVVALALVTGMLVVGGGIALANTVGSAMSVVSVYASETMQTDVGASVVAPDNPPSTTIQEQNVPKPAEEGAVSGHIPLWGWAEDSWQLAPIGYVDELPFTVSPINDKSELTDFASHYGKGDVLLPTYIPQGFNFAVAEFPGWQNHIFTAVTDMSADEVSVVAAEAYAPLHAARWGYDMNDWVGDFFWTGFIEPLEDGRTRLVYVNDESTLIDGFDWEVIAITPNFDTLRIYYTHENDHLTTITVWIREYRGWGWDEPTSWGNMTPVTVNGMNGFMNANELHLRDSNTDITYTIVSSSKTIANEATLIQIAESLR